MRHALTKYPDASYIWFLDMDGFLMNPLLTVEDHLMHPQTIEENMIRDHPVVPPDSIIKTFAHLQGGDVDLMVTQDKEGLSIGSLIVRNSVWARFFLETWWDPIYRSYNFQKAGTHALVRRPQPPDTTVPASPGHDQLGMHANPRLGTHCPVASHDSVEAGPGAPAADQRLQQ